MAGVAAGGDKRAGRAETVFVVGNHKAFQDIMHQFLLLGGETGTIVKEFRDVTQATPNSEAEFCTVG